MNTQSFISKYLNDAQIAAQQLGFPTSVVLAQWINETGSGSSSAFTQQNNYAGVSNNGQVDSYPDKTAGLAAYISRWGDPVYNGTRAAIASNGGQKGNPYTAAQAVEQSPWAAGHYGGNGLEAIIQQNDLQQYDTGATTFPIPSTLLGDEANAATLDSATGSGSSGGKCPEGNIFNITMPSVIPNLTLTKCQGRALLGGFCLVSGAVIIAVGLTFLAVRSKPVQQIAAVVPVKV